MTPKSAKYMHVRARRTARKKRDRFFIGGEDLSQSTRAREISLSSLAQNLGLKIERLEETVDAKGAFHSMKITHFAMAEVDLGSVTCTLKFMLVDSLKWEHDQVLMGYSTLESLNVVIDLIDEVMMVNGTMLVRMFPSITSAEKYIEKIRRKSVFLATKGVTLTNSIKVEPFTTETVEIFLSLSETEKVTLPNSNVFFKTAETNSGLKFVEYLIPKDYPWLTEPLRISVHNSSPSVRYIEAWETVGKLKPLADDDTLELLTNLKSKSQSIENASSEKSSIDEAHEDGEGTRW